MLSHGHGDSVDDIWLLIERDNEPVIRLYGDTDFVATKDTGSDVDIGLSVEVGSRTRTRAGPVDD